jgi:hypothetical protein
MKGTEVLLAVLNVAAAVLDRMFAAFPKSADVGVFLGPRPGILYNLSQTKLLKLIQRIEGVVLLTHDSHATDLQTMVGDSAMVLGIRESKGLEFPNSLVVDFFSLLASDHQKAWRHLLTIREDAQTEYFGVRLLPEIVNQLRLLYTVVTRCSKRSCLPRQCRIPKIEFQRKLLFGNDPITWIPWKKRRQVSYRH